MSTTLESSLYNALFPEDVITYIENETIPERNKCICGVAILAINCVLRTAEALESGNLRKVDPNPGDGGCQMRGYLHQPIL